MVNLSETKQKLRNYILENYLFTDDESALKNEDSLLDLGIIDSTGIMELIVYLEQDFNIKVEDQEMIPENLDSVDNLSAYVTQKLS
ncbi:acyl carrier protein [Aurantivibrio infirmus]